MLFYSKGFFDETSNSEKAVKFRNCFGIFEFALLRTLMAFSEIIKLHVSTSYNQMKKNVPFTTKVNIWRTKNRKI